MDYRVKLSQVLLGFSLPFSAKNPPLKEQFLSLHPPKHFNLCQITQKLSHNNKARHIRAIWCYLAKKEPQNIQQIVDNKLKNKLQII